MNWGDFKQEVEENGVFDETEIDLISTSGNFTNDWELQIRFANDGSCIIYAVDKNIYEVDKT